MKNILKKFGLSEKEAEVYLAALELGEATGFRIYKKTELKKPTVYYILDELQKRGLVSQTKKGKKRYFVAEDPGKIRKKIEDNPKSFDEILPELRSIFNRKATKPIIRFYEGRQGLEEVYADTLKYKGEILAFASEQIFHSLGQEFSESYVEKRIKAGIPVRAVMPSTENLQKNYIEKDLAQLRATKLINPRKYNFPIEINIYANKVALISFRDELGLIIESDEINRMTKMMFEFFWVALM
ncbi:MAG: helix-turn-helix domain-containing protein [Parcubacteria group bacterium]|jgi:sugar-specific transcriptional regulator TrmB